MKDARETRICTNRDIRALYISSLRLFLLNCISIIKRKIISLARYRIANRLNNKLLIFIS